jgi:hypothetical protein
MGKIAALHLMGAQLNRPVMDLPVESLDME